MKTILALLFLIPSLSWGDNDEKITTPKLSIPFNDYRENFNDKSNLVEPRGIAPLTSTLPA